MCGPIATSLQNKATKLHTEIYSETLGERYTFKVSYEIVRNLNTKLLKIASEQEVACTHKNEVQGIHNTTK